MIGGVPMCMGCRHLQRGTFNCAAFPHGIPLTILMNSFDHRFPAAGDNGVRYEPQPGGKTYGLAVRPQVQPES
jgi:hypothetical protein